MNTKSRKNTIAIVIGVITLGLVASSSAAARKSTTAFVTPVLTPSAPTSTVPH